MAESQPVRIFAPTAILGYGYNLESFERAMALRPDAIVVDGGSTDPGPNYLGSGRPFTDPLLVKRDLRPMLLAGQTARIPVIIGTAGGSGGDPHLDVTRRIVEEIVEEESLWLSAAVIHAEQSRDTVRDLLRNGRIRPLWPLQDLTEEDVARSARIVGLMGVEPFISALRMGASVVIAGRSDDAAISAGFAISRGIPPANAWLAGRFLECGAACTVPRHGFGYEGLLATLDSEGVTLEPVHPGLACTIQSVAAFLLHENQSPVLHQEPNGWFDLRDLAITSLDERRVRLVGARFDRSDPSIRLEGAQLAGNRTVTIGWTRDPVLIPQIDAYLERAYAKIAAGVAGAGIAREGDYQVQLRVIGKNAVMGEREPVRAVNSHELGIVVDTVAGTPIQAAAIATLARQAIKNAPYPGKLCDEGCVTFPYSPSEIPAGPVYRFSVWHVVSPADLLAMFPIELLSMGVGR